MKKIIQHGLDIWKLDFLWHVCTQKSKNHMTVVQFWIVSTVIISMIASVLFFMRVHNFVTHTVVQEIEKYISYDGQFSLNEGQFIASHITMPVRAEYVISTQKFIVILNTDITQYDVMPLHAYDGAVVVTSDRILVKNQKQFRIYNFDTNDSFLVTRSDIIKWIYTDSKYIIGIFSCIIFVIFLFFFGVIRLIGAVIWAGVLYVMARSLDITINYSVAYKAILQLYFIPTFVTQCISVPLLGDSIFFVIIVMNLVWMKKKQKIDAQIM